ncbi:hypothetical protein [Psychrosphaera algicola]|uniref:Uncharacterized protein n=1 Tax=Psychrosphaera algicola TaxID=3023714 RepID=A0ABT5FC63_9GAMM|nr:hypothetical protein [Psychrosphaera sp. G1-22]MDC2889118.1 hypothetical protein [Psychrosphaera sp. G1-22]
MRQLKNYFRDRIKNQKQKESATKALIDYLVKFKTNIILWGSPKVLIAQAEFEQQSKVSGNIFLAIDNLYRAIREDIGLSNSGLPSLHLVKMYLSDPEELESLIASSNKQINKNT